MIHRFIIKDLEVPKNFKVEDLYNPEKGLLYEEHRQLLKIALNKQYIEVHKYLIEQDIEDKIFDIYERKGKTVRLLHKLKCWPNESIFYAAQFVYILEKIDPNYKIINREHLSLLKINVEIANIRPRLDGENAEPRLYFENARLVMTSTHDSAQNLAEILLVKDNKVFVVGLDHSTGNLIAYEIVRDEIFYEWYKSSLQQIINSYMSKII